MIATLPPPTDLPDHWTERETHERAAVHVDPIPDRAGIAEIVDDLQTTLMTIALYCTLDARDGKDSRALILAEAETGRDTASLLLCGLAQG